MDKSEVSDTMNSLRIEDEDRALDLQERASAEANARDFAERQWINASKRVPMRIMVAGLGGAGKSTLINRLFGQDVNENLANEGCRGKATTEAVRCHKHKLKNDVEAIILTIVALFQHSNQQLPLMMTLLTLTLPPLIVKPSSNHPQQASQTPLYRQCPLSRWRGPTCN